MNSLKGEPARLMKNNPREVAASCIVEADTERLTLNNNGLQQGDPEEDDSDVAIGTSTSSSEPPATPTNEKLAGVPPVTRGPGSAACASPVLPSYPVGRGISLPLDYLLPTKCNWYGCSCSALISALDISPQWGRPSNPKQLAFLCLDHGLEENSATRDLVLKSGRIFNNNQLTTYSFISSRHEAAIRAFLA